VDKGNGSGEWVRGMQSALCLWQGTPVRGGLLAAAYRVLMALVFVGAFLFLFATGTREKRGSKKLTVRVPFGSAVLYQ
jgi:hypothetical protein